MSCYADSDSSDEDELLSYLKPAQSKVKSPVREEDTDNIEKVQANSDGQDSQVSSRDSNDLPFADQLYRDLAEINGQSNALTGQFDEESELSKEDGERTGWYEHRNKSNNLPVTEKNHDDLAEINQQIYALTSQLDEESAISKENSEKNVWHEDIINSNGLPVTDKISVDLAEINRQSNTLIGQLDEESALSKEDSERTGMNENVCIGNKSDFSQQYSDTDSEGEGTDSADLEKDVNEGEISSSFHNDIPREDPLPEIVSYPSYEIRSNCEAIRKQCDKSTVNEYIPDVVPDFAHSKNLESPMKKSTSSRYIMLTEHDFHRLCAIKSVKLPEDITAFENVSRHFITPESSPVKGCASQRKSEIDRSVLKGSKYLISHMEKGNTGLDLTDSKTSTSVLSDNVECGTQSCNANSTEKALTQEEKHEQDLSDVEIVFVKLFDDKADEQPTGGHYEADLPVDSLPQPVTTPHVNVDLATSLPETETDLTQVVTQVDTDSKCVSTVSPINSTNTIQSLPTSTVYPGITNDLVQSHDAVTMAQTKHLMQSQYTTYTGYINAEIPNPLISPVITHSAGPLDSGMVSSMDNTLSVTAQSGNSPPGSYTTAALTTEATSNDLNLSSIETSQINKLDDAGHRNDTVTISGKSEIGTEQGLDAGLGDENQSLSSQSLKSLGSNEIFESHDFTDEVDEMMEVDHESCENQSQSVAGIEKTDGESYEKRSPSVDGIGEIDDESCWTQSQCVGETGQSPVAAAPRVQVRFERKNNKLTRIVQMEDQKHEATPASSECIVLRLNKSGELVRCDDNENTVIDLTDIHNSPDCKKSNKDHSSIKTLWKSFVPFTSHKRTVKREEEMFSSDESEEGNIGQEYFEHISESSGDEELTEYFSGKSNSKSAIDQADFDDVSDGVEYVCPSSAPSPTSKQEHCKPVEKVNKMQNDGVISKTVSERKLMQKDNDADSESVSEDIGICRNKSDETTPKVETPRLKKNPSLEDKADNSNTLESDHNGCLDSSTPVTKDRSKVCVGKIINGSSEVVSKHGNEVKIDGETIESIVKMKINENEDTELRMRCENTEKDCASKDSKLEVQSKPLKSKGTESLSVKSEKVKMKRIVRKRIKPKQSARKVISPAKQRQSRSVSNEARKTITPVLSGKGNRDKDHKEMALKSLAQQVEMKRMKKTRLKEKSPSEIKTTRKRKNSDQAADVVKVKRKRMDKQVEVYKKVNGKKIHTCSSSSEVSHSPSKTTSVRKRSVKQVKFRRKLKPKCHRVKKKVRLRHHPVLKKCGEITWKEKLSDKIYEVESVENKKPVNVKKMIRQILETPEAKEQRRKEKTERKSKHVKSGKVHLKQEVSQLSPPSRVKLTSESDDSETPSQFPAFKFCDGAAKPEATILINQKINTEPQMAIAKNHPKVKTKAFSPKKTVLSPIKTVPFPKQVIESPTKQSEAVGASCTNKPRVSFNESVTKKCLNTEKLLHSPLKGMIESEAVINENKASEDMTSKSEGIQCASPPPKIPCRLQNSIDKLRAMLNIPDRMVKKTRSTSVESQVEHEDSCSKSTNQS